MKVLFTLLIGAVALTSCGSSDSKTSTEDRMELIPDQDGHLNPDNPNYQGNKTNQVTHPDYSVALTFINDYTKHCISVDMDKWIPKHKLLSPDFKNAYKALADSMRKEDPEMGMDFDPIFDAQDFPDKGFFLKNTDSIGGYVTVEGKNWKDFTVVLKVISKDGKSLVDGAGIINMPRDK